MKAVAIALVPVVVVLAALVPEWLRMRRFRLAVRCQRCLGRGRIYVLIPNDDVDKQVCPDCNGVGVAHGILRDAKPPTEPHGGRP